MEVCKQVVTAPAWCWGYNQEIPQELQGRAAQTLPPPPRKRQPQRVEPQRGVERGEAGLPEAGAWSLQTRDITRFQERGFCAQSGLTATHRSGVTPSEQAAQGHRGIRANPG